MPTRLLLIAHGATAATRRAAFPIDEAIEPLAHDRAAALAPTLPRGALAWSGPERRAIETAEAFGLSAEIDPALADLDLGRWRGKTFDELLAAEPDALAAWTSDPASAPHDGESVEHLIARLAAWLDGHREAAGRVIAVTHPAVLRAAVVVALGAPATGFWRIDAGPLARLDLRSDGRRWTLRELTAQMPGDAAGSDG